MDLRETKLAEQDLRSAAEQSSGQGIFEKLYAEIQQINTTQKEMLSVQKQILEINQKEYNLKETELKMREKEYQTRDEERRIEYFNSLRTMARQ